MVFKPGMGFVSSNYVIDTKKLNPFRVHFMRPFNPHVGSLRLPTWGFQKHNSYRVANMENNKIYYKYETFKSTTDTTNAIDEVVVTGLYKTFKSTTRTELPPHLSPAILPHSHYDETIRWKLPRNLTLITL